MKIALNNLAGRTEPINAAKATKFVERRLSAPVKKTNKNKPVPIEETVESAGEKQINAINLKS